MGTLICCDHLRFFIVDLILRLVEELSTADNYSDVISSNGDLFRLVCEVVKLPDKFEVCMLLDDYISLDFGLLKQCILIHCTNYNDQHPLH